MINIAHILPPALNHDFVKKKKKRFLCEKKDFFAIIISELCQIHAESKTLVLLTII